MNRKIQLLDERTVNKIAAGEVVERPASVIKELIENSIDAEAKSITIEIINGGKKYIRITDNGNGIESEDLELSIVRHATSKIREIDDLDKLVTLGFRGEALASIASVSQMQIISKTSKSSTGKQIEIHGGEIINNKIVGCPKGTTVIVKNLFYNTPVRNKFLKSDNIESSYISDVVYRSALGHPNISFKYVKDNRLIVKTPGNNDESAVIYSLFGKEFLNSLFKINYNGEDIRIRGYISKPSFTRGNRNGQFFFVNGRYIKCQLLSKVLERNYKTLVPINRFPVCVIYIEIKPDMIDANVHPTKIEIRFKDEELIKNILSNMIETSLKENNLIPQVTFGTNKEKDSKEEQQTIDLVNYNDKKHNNINTIIKEYEDRGFKDNTNIEPSESNPLVVEIYEGDSHKELDREVKSDGLNDREDIKKQPNNENNKLKLPELKIIGILFETYILAEDANDEIFYIIDQHAAHERIMYEKLKTQFENQKIVAQEMLTPEIINLTHGEYQMVKENLDIFNKTGFKIEPFGINSVIIRSVPVLFGEPDCKKLFFDLLDKIKDDIKSSYELRLEKIMKMACTSAVKAGDKIKDWEIEGLITDLKNTKNPYTCPHGRPIIVKMTKYELEKKFKRIQ